MKGLFLFSLFALLSVASVSGLTVSPSSFSINKTNGIDYTILFNVTNNLSFKFYNITSDSLISFTPFDLDSGQTAIVSGKVTSNEVYNGEINIYGTYFANLGASNNTEYVYLSSDIDNCDLSLIVGDKIVWTNELYRFFLVLKVD